MKKVKFIAVTVIGLFIGTGCVPEKVYETVENPVEIYSEEFAVRGAHWAPKSDASGPFFECVLESPALARALGTAYFDGIIMVYLFLDYDSSAETQIPLPYTFYGTDGRHGFSISYVFDMMADGTVGIRGYPSDGLNPGDQVFRVAIARIVTD